MSLRMELSWFSDSAEDMEEKLKSGFHSRYNAMHIMLKLELYYSKTSLKILVVVVQTLKKRSHGV